MSEYFVYFVTGLLGSGHCVGMCGPIVLAYSVQLKNSTHQTKVLTFFTTSHLLTHLSYNFGRVFMWVFLGMILAMTGRVVTLLTNFESILSVAGGLLILLLGVGRLGILPGFKFGKENSGRIFNIYQRMMKPLIMETSLSGKLALGLLNGLLPCGFSYAFLIKATVSGSPVVGGLIMFSFGLGTIPALFLTGILASQISERIRKWGEGLAIGIIIFMGLVLILRGFGYHIPFINFFAPGATHHH